LTGGVREQLERGTPGIASSSISRADPEPRDPDTGRAEKWILGPGLPRARPAREARSCATPFDPFGWTTHRRRERELIAEYERTLDELFAGLSHESHPLAVEIASIPEHIRGFDLVKDRHLHDAKAKEATLLAGFRERATPAGAAGGV
jgi:indolepyruvate ferredoxin oxidoreductase